MRRMQRLLATIMIMLVMVVGLPPAISFGSTVAEVQKVPNHIASSGTNVPCNLTSAPTAGNVMVSAIAWNSAATLTIPTGWTVLFTQTNTSLSEAVEVIYRVAQSGDTASQSSTGVAYTSTLSASSGAECIAYELSGENPTTPFVGFASTSQNAVTSATVTATPTGSPSFPVAIFFTRSATTAFTTTAPWSQDAFVNNYGGLQGQSQGQITGTSAVTATAGFGSTSSYVAEGMFFVNPQTTSTLINGLGSMHVGGPHVSAVVSIVSSNSSIPALPPWETYMGDGAGGGYNSMDHISVANAKKWCNYAQSSTATTTSISGGDTGGANGSNCLHNYAYTGLNTFRPNANGVENDFPWIGGFTGTNCPASLKASAFAKTTGTDAPNWTSSSPLQNWFMYEVPSGSTYGIDANRIQAWYGSTYMFFTNLASTSLQQAVNDAVQTCTQGSQVLDTYYEGLWNDNLYPGLQNNPSTAWVVWWGEGAYDKQINWGTVNGTPYTGSTCNSGPSTSTFWNGSQCTISSQIDSVPMTSGNTTYGPDTGTGTNKTSTTIKAWQSMMAAVKHKNGSLVKWQFNDMLNGYAACQIANKEPNVTGGFDEEAVIRGSQSDGRLQLASTLENIIDVASDDNACGGLTTFFIHDYLATSSASYYSGSTLTSMTNGAALGTPTEQEDLRAHFYMIWLLVNDAHPQMMGSMTHACNNSTCQPTYNSWTDVWPADFAAPSGRVTPYPTEALGNGQLCSDSTTYDHNGTNQLCTQGGAHDSNICASGTPPNCLFIATYNHFWVWDYTACASGPDQTQWTSCAKDIGPFTVLYNLTASTLTLSTTNLNTWIGSSTFSSENYMLWPGCQPTTAAYGSTAGSTIYPGDNGGINANTTPSTTNVCTGSTMTDVYYGGRMGAVAKTSLGIGSTTGPTLLSGESIGWVGSSP